ncbi:MAG: JAB domain-containing protein [bacterium]
MYKGLAVRIEMIRETVEKMGPAVKTPQTVWELLSDLRKKDREYFVVLCLNSKNRVLCINTISVGTLNASMVHPREVFKPAILANSASIILAHNHPSGEPEPSREDKEITKQIMEAGKILNIPLLDHVILGGESWISLKIEKLM